MSEQHLEEFVNDFNFADWLDDYSRKCDEEIVEAFDEADQ